MAMNHAAMLQSQRQRLLLEDKHARQEAVAQFPLRVAQMAADMAAILETQRHRASCDSADAAIDYIEDRIRREFLATFGHEMVANPD